MSDDLEIAKLRTTSPATGTAEMIRRCHWAHDRIEALTAALENADALAAQLDGRNVSMEKVYAAAHDCREAREATK